MTMNRKEFFHLCANGAEVRNFIICRNDYAAAFNLIGVCAANIDVMVVSFSLEDSHPHILLYGTYGACVAFKNLYEQLYLRHAAIYTIIQATKDGKPVMPYDYPWGTGSMYFRSGYYTPVWYFDTEGRIQEPVLFSPKKREEEMLSRMSDYRGIALEDQEARNICGEVCKQLYGIRDPRRLKGGQRLELARELRHRHHLTFRQLSLLVRLPESEIRFYVR